MSVSVEILRAHAFAAENRNLENSMSAAIAVVALHNEHLGQ